jgi:hypothetical protein
MLHNLLFYFAQNAIYVIIFFSSNNSYFINHVLKFKYQTSYLKVNYLSRVSHPACQEIS